MKNIRTEIVIDAGPAAVWNTLMDFAEYKNWNPFIHLTGRAEVGSRLENTIFLEGRKPQVFRPEVLAAVPEKEFRWEGHLFVRGLFDGEHYFQLEAVPGGKCRLIHGENFRGILAGMILGMIGEQTRKGFETMNRALKERVGQLAVTQ
ncbi:MAG: SRPBCC domain-containing protein [Phaeodactylibacter sp.]|nr:SRPBCC domain-containing protein [Phaeodactylibacter sp.]